MINQYFRPNTVEEALKLLSSTGERIIPLGGGTHISHSHDSVSVVDLQNLGLNQIQIVGNSAILGGTVTLQGLADNQEIQQSLCDAASRDLNFNLRQTATLAGMIVTGGGRSVILTTLLAYDAVISWLPGSKVQSLSDFLLTRDHDWPGKIIEYLKIPTNAMMKFASIGRSPADLPVICLAVAKWPSGRVRVALGGFGPSPILALDAPEPGGIDFAVRDALVNSTDQWASGEYRQSAAAVLVRRLLSSE